MTRQCGRLLMRSPVAVTPSGLVRLPSAGLPSASLARRQGAKSACRVAAAIMLLMAGAKFFVGTKRRDQAQTQGERVSCRLGRFRVPRGGGTTSHRHERKMRCCFRIELRNSREVTVLGMHKWAPHRIASAAPSRSLSSPMIAILAEEPACDSRQTARRLSLRASASMRTTSGARRATMIRSSSGLDVSPTTSISRADFKARRRPTRNRSDSRQRQIRVVVRSSCVPCVAMCMPQTQSRSERRI